MKVSVTEFKSRCTQLIREVGSTYDTIEVTNRGRVVAVVSAPPPADGTCNPAWGQLHGTVTRVADDFDEPLGDREWEAARP